MPRSAPAVIATLALSLAACIESHPPLLDGGPPDMPLAFADDRGSPPDDAGAGDTRPDGAVAADARLADARLADEPDGARDGGPDRADEGPPARRDRDGDGVLDGDDPCPEVASRLPRDVDGDGLGDACDEDDDGDGLLDVFDPCPWIADESGPEDCAADRDADGRPDAEDDCPTVPDPGDVPCPGPLLPQPWLRATTALLADGDTLLAGGRGGLLRVDGQGLALDAWTVADGLGPWIADLTRGDDGALWVAHDQGLSVIRPDGLVLRAGEEAPRPPAHAVALGDGVWFTDDRGLWQLSPVGRVRVGEPARALVADGRGAIWRVDARSAARLEPMLEVVDGVQAIAPLHGGVAGADGLWLLGAAGVAHVREGQVDRVYILDAPVHTLVEREGQVYLGTASTVRRIDRDGRLLPPPRRVDGAHPPLPPGAVRALAVAADGRLWAGADGGLFALDGVLSVLDGPDLSCATAVERFADQIWIGTDDGLRTVDVDGRIARVDGVRGLRVSAIARIADALWVGTEAGVTIVGPDGVVRRTLAGGDELPRAPISAITARGDEVWLATDGAGLLVGGPDAWQQRDVGNFGLLSDVTSALVDDGEYMWVATRLGADRWHYGRQRFEPFDRGFGALGTVFDVAIEQGQPFIAAVEGVVTSTADGFWVTLRRQVGGVPNEAGTDRGYALAHDGEHLWIALDVSRRMEAGSLLRRAPDPAIRPTAETLWSLADLGAPAPRVEDHDLRWLGEELALSACGDADSPGGVWLIGGRGLMALDTSARRLPGGPDMHLAAGPDGWPMAIGRGAVGPVATFVERGALVPIALPAGDAAPTACAAADDALWCIFDDDTWARGFGNEQWNRGVPAALGLPPGIALRDIALGAPHEAWIASDHGLVHIDGADVRLIRQIDAGLIDDDVRAVRIADGRVYVATAAGASIYTMATDRWFDLAPAVLPSASVRRTRLVGETLWVATDDGLVAFAADGTPLDDPPGVDRLRGLRVNDVAADAAGRLYATTDEALFVLDADGGRRRFGAVHGLPGAGADRLVVDPDGDIWLAGADGLTRIDPRRL